MDQQFYALKARIAALEAVIALAEAEIKGGKGSGNWGHAGGRGGKGRPGGSRPRSEAMSRTSGRDWQKRQAAARAAKNFSDEDSKKLVSAFKKVGGIKDTPESEELLYKAALEFKKVYPNEKPSVLLVHAQQRLTDIQSIQTEVDNIYTSNKKIRKSIVEDGDSDGFKQQLINDNVVVMNALQRIQDMSYESPLAVPDQKNKAVINTKIGGKKTPPTPDHAKPGADKPWYGSDKKKVAKKTDAPKPQSPPKSVKELSTSDLAVISAISKGGALASKGGFLHGPSTDIDTGGFGRSASEINLSKKYKSLVDRGVITEKKQVKGTSRYELTELGKKLHGQI